MVPSWGGLSQAALALQNLPSNAGDIRDCGLGPWVGKIPWRRKWQPTPYSHLKNPTDRGTWRATVHRVPKSRTQLKQLSRHTLSWGFDEMRWFDSITKSTDMNLTKLWETRQVSEPGVLQSKGSQRTGHNLVAEQQQQQ